MASQTRYVYDGWNLIAEYAISEGTTFSLKRSYTWGLDITKSLTNAGGVGGLLQVHAYADNKSYLAGYDGNGNVVALFNGAPSGAGAVDCVAAYEYSPYGEFLRCEGTYAKANPSRFSTKFTDDESRLIYYGRRYYSPSQGRFFGTDPIEEDGGINLYSFCANDGINLSDFLGMVWYYPQPNTFGPSTAVWISTEDAMAQGDFSDIPGLSKLKEQFGDDLTFDFLRDENGAISAIQFNLALGGATYQQSFSTIRNAEGELRGIDFNVAGFAIPGLNQYLSYNQNTGIMAVLGSNIGPGAMRQAMSGGSANMGLYDYQSLAAQLGWNGFSTNLSESQQIYYGATAANLLARGLDGRDYSREWKGIVDEVPGVITDSRGLIASDAATAARTSFTTAAVIAGATGISLGAIAASGTPIVLLPELNAPSMQSTLAQNGWQVAGSGNSKNGPFLRMQNGSTSVTFYTSTSGGGVPTAQVFQSGKPVLKIRLGQPVPPIVNPGGRP